MNKSKRRSSTALPRSAKKNKNEDMCELEVILKESGLLISKSSNSLEVDQAMFLKNMNDTITKHRCYPQVIDELLSNFETISQNTQMLETMLRPTVLSSESGRLRNADSLVKLLLRLDFFQEKLSNSLLERIAELSLSPNDSSVNLCRLIICQFRWIEHIVNPQNMIEKMLEVISVTGSDVQREIISCLPEVIYDDHHTQLALHLTDLMNESNELTVIILDTLSNLNLTSDLLDQVCGNILKTLASIEEEHIPIAIKFVLQTLEPSKAVQILHELRSNLEFKSSIPAMFTSTPFASSTQQDSNKKQIELLTLDVIKSSMRFHKFIADAWIKVIESINISSEHKVADVFVLLIIHCFSTKRKTVESLLRNKVRAACFDDVLIQAAFSTHPQVVIEYFGSVLRLCEILLQSTEKDISSFACSMFIAAFKSANTFGCQEIIVSLINHIGSGVAHEVNQALNVMETLAKDYPAQMAKFSIFIKAILDYVDHLSLAQIRQVYTVLCLLAYNPTNANSSIQDELNIIIRKQLSNAVHKYKRMGVVGALVAVTTIASRYIDDDAEERELNEESNRKWSEEAVQLLEMVKTCTMNKPQAIALFYDELANAIVNQQLNNNILIWTNETLVNDFQDDFIVEIDLNQDDVIINKIEAELRFAHDAIENGGNALNLFEVLIKTKSDTTNSEKSKSSPVVVVSQFRLLQACERSIEGNLDGIDALIGCPIVFPKYDVDEFQSYPTHKQHVICDSMFYAINWMIELVNAFVDQSDEPIKEKVMKRMSDIHHLITDLRLLLSYVSNYKAPIAKFDVDVSADCFLSASTSKKKPADKKKKQVNDTNANITSTCQTNCDLAQSISDNCNSTNPVPFHQITPYIRDFDLKIYSLLQNTAILAGDQVQLGEIESQFLLDSLCANLKNCLASRTTQSGLHISIRNSKQVIEEITELLPLLCSLLEASVAFFQKRIDDCDGIVDSLDMFNAEALTMAAIMLRVLEIILLFFSWNGFNSSENRSSLKNGLTQLVHRTEPQFKSRNLNELSRRSADYLLNYGESIANLSCGMSLVKLLEVLCNWVNSKEEVSCKISDCCHELLKRQWSDQNGKMLKGAEFNAQIHTLFSCYLKYNIDVSKCLEDLVTGAVSELVEADAPKNACSKSLPNLNRCTFSIFYRLMLHHLVNDTKNKVNYDRQNSANQKLQVWTSAIKVFHVLVHLIKEFDGRSNILACLKNGRLFVELFLKQGMPLLERLFKSHREDVINILKKLQLSTRFLQHVCSHSKVSRDITLTNHVPLIRKSLESLIFRVKAMLAANKCQEAFWLGNLKNRDLQGDEIFCEHSLANSDSENEDIPDDNMSDTEVDKETSKLSNKSDAEIMDESSTSGFSDIF